MLDVVDSLEGKGASSFLGFTPIKTAVVDEKNKVTDEVPSPHISGCGHGLLVSTYFLLLAGYLAYAIHSYVTRPEVETYSQQPSYLYPAPVATIRLQCFTNPHCGTITLTRNYSTAKESHCKNRAFAVQDETNRTLNNPFETELCYAEENSVFSVNTGELLSTPGTVLDFSGISTGITSSPPAYAAVSIEIGNMKKLVTMDPWQVKSFYIGMSVTQKDGETSIAYYAQNLQYDGKRPTNRATYIIRLAQFANVYEVTRPGSWLDILAQLGGAATLVAAVLLISEPVVTKVFPGGESRLMRGRMAPTRGSRFQPLSSDAEPKSVQSNPLPPLTRSHSKGDAVQVLYNDTWHPATVTASKGETLDVTWDDGTVSRGVPSTAIKKDF